MEHLTTFALAEGAEVSLAALGITATSIAGVIWVMKYFAKELSRDLRAHTRAAEQHREASMRSAQASEKLEQTVEKVGIQAELTCKNSQQLLTFMKNLNGKLAKATIQTVQEQTVQEQTVEHQTIKE